MSRPLCLSTSCKSPFTTEAVAPDMVDVDIGSNLAVLEFCMNVSPTSLSTMGALLRDKCHHNPVIKLERPRTKVSLRSRIPVTFICLSLIWWSVLIGNAFLLTAKCSDSSTCKETEVTRHSLFTQETEASQRSAVRLPSFPFQIMSLASSLDPNGYSFTPLPLSLLNELVGRFHGPFGF